MEKTRLKMAKKCYYLEKKFVSNQQSENLENTKQSSIMISQKFFDETGGTEVEVLHPLTIYQMKVIVMNCNDSALQGTLIAQIPKGSVPLGKSNYTQYSNISVGGFNILKFDYFFYYSDLTDFHCYPTSIISDNKIIAQAEIKSTMKVQLPEAKDFKQVLEQFGKQSADELSSIDLTQVYHKLKDEDFYNSIISILKKRFEFDPTVWSFSILHGDLENLRDYVKYLYQNDAIRINQFDIFFFCNKIFSTDYFNFREYSPLTNPRVHNISQYRHNIINRDFLNTYYIFLKYVQDKGRFENSDLISLCVYLLMQDRFQEAADIFKRIIPSQMAEGCPLKIQYDYIDCFLSLAFGKMDHAKDIAKRYVVYPVLNWRDLFRECLKQVYEYEDFERIEDMSQKKTEDSKSSKTETILQATSYDGKIQIKSKGVHEVSIELYDIDIETMFSTNIEYLLHAQNVRTYLKPNFTFSQTLEDKPGSREIRETTIEVPDSFKSKNFIAKISSGSHHCSVKISKHSLKILPVEAYGQLKVCSLDGKALPKCYVKCLKMGHSSSQYTFYKDGYTDLRGNFDYVSLNSNSLASVKEFMILVVSEDHGCFTAKVLPPKKVTKSEGLKLNAVAKRTRAF
jgi:hypothetical protein